MKEANQKCILYEYIQSQAGGTQWWRVVDREPERAAGDALFPNVGAGCEHSLSVPIMTGPRLCRCNCQRVF